MIPGKILVVDDLKGDVDDLLREFSNRGEHAVYSGLPFTYNYFEDARLLVFDYWLFEQSETDSLSAISEIINSVFKKSKFFMVVIWSVKVTGANRMQYRNNILKAYHSRFHSKLPCILLDPISKDELNYIGLIRELEKEIARHPELNLLYEAEKIVNDAKNKVGAQIYEIGSWSNVVKTLRKEYDLESTERLLLDMYLNMLKRNSKPTAQFKECTRKIKANLGKKSVFSDVDFGKIYSAQYYYQVSDKEQIGTGDILHSKKSGKYYMVITPECDIANDKHTATKLIESMRISHSKLTTDKKYVKKIAKLFSLGEKDGSVNPSRVIGAIIHGSGLRTNYSRLLFLKDKGRFYHLVFDFHKARSLRKAKRMSYLKGYTRLCRVDSPLLNSFIQQYAAHSSRFGTMTIPEEMSGLLAAKLPKKIT